MIGNSVLLDSSVVVRHFRDATALCDKLASYEEIYVPQTVLGELYYGAFKSVRPAENVVQIERFLIAVNVLDSDSDTARLYGKVAAQLARNGTPIPQNDIWIAAAALQFGLPVATADEHFQQVDGLEVLIW